ncbi:MAG: rRNA pseudouridine synthase [Oscillospiraceae bacterium]|nr:rRNA pseudouridine synthase [Oscillospiraceae bacterium]
MNERLQKIIAAAGLCSRRRAEEWIAQGKVTVNGGLARLGDTADPALDEILVEGKPLPAAPAKNTTILLYKPRGCVTTLSDEKGRPTVAELLPQELGRLYPVGRLDQFSEGLLLMTNDGALANRLTHPAGEVRKTYRLWVSGWHGGALALLRRPIELDGRRIAPPQVRLLWAKDGGGMQNAKCKMQNEAPVGYDHAREAGRSYRSATGGEQNTAALEITIHEGRNRQIRRMAEAAGLTVTRLKRVAEGPLTLGELKPGEWRLLTEAELQKLINEIMKI